MEKFAHMFSPKFIQNQSKKKKNNKITITKNVACDYTLLFT